MNNSPLISIFFVIFPGILYFIFLFFNSEFGYLIIIGYFVIILLVDKYARKSLILLKVSLHFDKTLLNFLKGSPYCNKMYPRLFICDIKFFHKIFVRMQKKRPHNTTPGRFFFVIYQGAVQSRSFYWKPFFFRVSLVVFDSFLLKLCCTRLLSYLIMTMSFAFDSFVRPLNFFFFD